MSSFFLTIVSLLMVNMCSCLPVLFVCLRQESRKNSLAENVPKPAAGVKFKLIQCDDCKGKKHVVQTGCSFLKKSCL